MNFGGNNSRDNAPSTNTRGKNFFNKDGFYPSTLQVGYWNELVSLRVHPALDKSKQTDGKVFDYDQNVATAITTEKAATLGEYISTTLIENFKNKVAGFQGVQVNGDSLVGVGTKQVGDRFVTYLAIYKSLDEKTRKPAVSIWYEFTNTNTINNYNPETGDFEVGEAIPSEVKEFGDILNKARIDLYNAGAHATRVVDKFYRDGMNSKLDEIGSKLGVAPKSSGGYRRNSNNDVFASGGSRQTETPSSYTASTESMTNIEDIDQFMQ